MSNEPQVVGTVVGIAPNEIRVDINRKYMGFIPAEEYHQDYLIKNPAGYCHITREEYEAVRKLNDEV